jgi:hypothetical protein
MMPMATKRLFSHVHLLPTRDSANKARTILENDGLMPLVTTISIQTSLENTPHPEWEIESWADSDLDDANRKEYDTGTSGELSRNFKALLNDIGLFKNLRRLELKSDWEVVADEIYVSGCHSEYTEYRHSFLRNFFRALNHAEHPALKFHSLSICNLQDLSDYETLRSEDFKAVLSRIDTLELCIATEEYERAREREIEFLERHQFFGADLVDLWLAPVQQNLVNLKLYSNCYWGYLPKCDLRKLHFPKLKSLAFGMMTFTHDWQLDWIISHGQTLESLRLYDCPIVHDAKVAQIMDSERYVQIQHDGVFDWRDNSTSTWSYGSRWHDYFQKMTVGLPRLQHFGMAHFPWGIDFYEHNADGAHYDSERSAFETSASLPAMLQGGRYFVFEWGTAIQFVAPSGDKPYYGVSCDCTEKFTKLEDQYVDGWHQDDEFPRPAYPDCWDQDQEAFEVFMAAVEGRRARKQGV